MLRLYNIYAEYFYNLLYLFYSRICFAYTPHISYNFYLLKTLNSIKIKIIGLYISYIYTNLMGLKTEQNHKIKFGVLTLLNFLTLPSFL